MDSDTFKKTQTKLKSCLKRSTSATDLGSIDLIDISNLRDAKSYALEMALNYEDIIDKKTKQLELTCKNHKYKIETKDVITNEVVILPNEILNWQGNLHTIHEISYKWKKDCRMWLWKNTPEYKKNRSISEYKQNHN